MSVKHPKVSLHLYLNNPHGLLSAAIPNYTLRQIEATSSAGGTDPRGSNVLQAYPVLPTLQESSDDNAMKQPNKFHEEHNVRHLDKRVDNVEASGNVAETLREARDNHVGAMNENQSDAKRSKRARDEIVHGSPTLGFTWSLNLEHKDRVIAPRRPPPKSLLQKLGCRKLAEPVGVVKIKVDSNVPPADSVHVVRFSEKAQRRVTEKLSAEWLDHYNEISSRQQRYLKQIQDLRRGLEKKNEKNIIVAIDDVRNNETLKSRRRYPLYAMSRMEGSAINQGPDPFPNRPCYVHIEEKKLPVKPQRLSPRITPRKLAPIVRKAKVNKTGTGNKVDKSKNSSNSSIRSETSPRPEMPTMKTDYESFESIARRNKLNLAPFFSSSLSHRRSNQRVPMLVSTITIVDEPKTRSTGESDSSPMEYITDVSGKKEIMLNLKTRDKQESPASSLSLTGRS